MGCVDLIDIALYSKHKHLFQGDLPDISPKTKSRLLVQEAVVKGDLLSSGPPAETCCMLAAAVYRSANGWIVYYTMAAALPGQPDWGSAIAFSKDIASKIPSLESAAKFISDPADAIVLPPKMQDRSLAEALAFNPLAAPEQPVLVSTWPEKPTPEESAKKGSQRVRLDVGWTLWADEPEGVDMQFQV